MYDATFFFVTNQLVGAKIFILLIILYLYIDQTQLEILIWVWKEDLLTHWTLGIVAVKSVYFEINLEVDFLGTYNQAVRKRLLQDPVNDRSMMTSSKGNIFCVTGHLCGELTDHRWIPRTKASNAELWCFL